MNLEKTLTLENEKGKSLTLKLREYQEGDEAGMIACIRDEYGDTYFKRGFYNPQFIREEAREQHILFLVAQTLSGKIVGMMILKQFYPEESMCEIASQIFLKKYRGYGLAMPFFRFGIEIMLERNYSAAYCLPVVFHDITQRLLYRYGLHATGFFLNVFDMEQIHHSYKKDENTKHAQAIQIKALGKTDAGVLYIPREHQNICKQIYDRLDVNYQLAEEPECKVSAGMPDRSDIIYINDEVQSNLAIKIKRVGQDLEQQLTQIHSTYPLKGKQTVNVLLNCNDVNGVFAYRILKKMGYFFTGLKPLCSESEYMVLHHCGEVVIHFDTYVVSEEFKLLLSYVKNCAEKRKNIG